MLHFVVFLFLFPLSTPKECRPTEWAFLSSREKKKENVWKLRRETVRIHVESAFFCSPREKGERHSCVNFNQRGNRQSTTHKYTYRSLWKTRSGKKLINFFEKRNFNSHCNGNAFFVLCGFGAGSGVGERWGGTAETSRVLSAGATTKGWINLHFLFLYECFRSYLNDNNACLFPFHEALAVLSSFTRITPHTCEHKMSNFNFLILKKKFNKRVYGSSNLQLYVCIYVFEFLWPRGKFSSGIFMIILVL